MSSIICHHQHRDLELNTDMKHGLQRDGAHQVAARSLYIGKLVKRCTVYQGLTDLAVCEKLKAVNFYDHKCAENDF